ncbi:MAG TPA: hypothetical protein VF618_09345 [Thermoanaerobaculia bacterium]
MKTPQASRMRYPAYDPEVNAILDVARAAHLAHEANPMVSATDIIGRLEPAARQWAWSLIEIIMDHEKRERRHAELWSKWKRWRNKRESIKRVARPNANWLGDGLPRT